MFRYLASAAVALASVAVAAPAFAHHGMDGETPNTLTTGLISGLAHPVIGLDHLAFILAAGLLAAPRARGLLLPLAFVIASAAGSVLHLTGLALPASEILVAASVLLLGVLLAIQARIGDGLFAAILALSGLFHGYAFAESIFGAEPTPLLAYLAGLALIEYALAGAVVMAWRMLSRNHAALLPQLSRLAGAAVMAAGTFFLVMNLTA